MIYSFLTGIIAKLFFPAETQALGIIFAFAIFGGTSPLIATALAVHFKTAAPVGLYFVGSALIAVLALTCVVAWLRKNPSTELEN